MSGPRNSPGLRSALRSPWIGDVEWEAKSELTLPFGLPGFEDERRMIPVEIPAQRPLVYLQSVARPEVCFVCMPVLVIDPAFQLSLSDEDRAALGVPEESPPVIGRDVLCLGLLVPAGDTVQVDLAAPIVISLLNACCIQSIAAEPPDGRQAGKCYRLEADGKWAAAC